MKVVKSDKTMVMFHGGCDGCTIQQLVGVDKCFDCCYFDAKWDKPNLNNRPPDAAERLRTNIKHRRLIN